MAILERTPPRRREDASQQASTSAIPISAQTQQHEFPSLDAMAMPFREGSATAMSPSISRSPGKKQPVMASTLSPADKIVRRLSTVATHPKQPLPSAKPADVKTSPTVGRRVPSPRKGEAKSPVAKRALQQSWKRKAPSASPERAMRPARPADANPSSVDDAFQRQLEAALLADNPFLKERTRKMDEKERAPATVPSPMPTVTAAAVQGHLEEQLPRQLVTASALLQDEKPLHASKAAGTPLPLPQPSLSFHEEVIIKSKVSSTTPDRSDEIDQAGVNNSDTNEVLQEKELEPVAHQEGIASNQSPSSNPMPTFEVSRKPSPTPADRFEERVEEEQIALPNSPLVGRGQMRPKDEMSYPSATGQPMVQPRTESSMMYSQSHVDTLEKHIEKLEKRHRQLAKESQKLRNSLTEAKADAESMFTRWTADKKTADKVRQDAGKHRLRIYSAEAARDLALFEESQRAWEQVNGPEGLEAARQTRIKLIEARNEANYQKARANEQSMTCQELELRLDDLRVREERALEGQAKSYEASMRQLTREHEAAIRQQSREHEAAARELRSAKGTSAFEEKERRNLATRLERIETERANLAVESQGYARLLEEERERCARLREEMATMRGRATIEQELRRELALLQSELKQAKRQTRPAPSSSVAGDRSPIAKWSSSVAAGKRKAAPSTRIMQSVRSHIVDDSEEEQASLDEEVSDFDERRPTRAVARSQLSRPATRANAVTRAPVAKAKLAPVARKRSAEPAVDRKIRQEHDDDFDEEAATKRHPHSLKPQKEGQRRGNMPSTREIELVDEKFASEAETGDDDNDDDDDDDYEADEYTVKKASKTNNAKKRLLGKGKVPTVEAALAANVASTKSSSSSASASANDKKQAKEDEKRRKAMQEHVEATPIISAAAKRPRPIPAAKRSSPGEEDGEEAAQSPLSAKNKEATALLTGTDNKENEVKDQATAESTKELQGQQELSSAAAAPPPPAAVASQQQQPKKRKLLLNRNKQPASANFLDMRGNADGNLEPVFNLPLAMSPIKGAQQQLQPQGTTKMGGRAGTSGFGAGANSVFRR